MLSILTTHTHKIMGRKETSGDDGHVYYLYCGGDIMVYAYVQTHQIEYIKYVPFLVYQLYFNKAVFFFFLSLLSGVPAPQVLI